jgi:predicted NACHT family NTPase
MQSSEKGLAGNLIGVADLEAILTDYLKTIEVEQARTVARVFINQLRTRNFILCFLGADSYGFVHRTFLEYFCAWEFVWQFKETQTLTLEGLINEVFGAHWQDESWHEVLWLICGMIEPKFVVKAISDILEKYILEKEKNHQLFDKGKKYTNEDLKKIILISKCFIEVKNKQHLGFLCTKLQEEVKKAFEYLNNEHEYADQESLAIAYYLQGDLDRESFKILSCVKDYALQDENVNVRRRAIEAIAEGWKEDPDTLSFLKDRTLQDQDKNIRSAAVRTIAQGWKEDPGLFEFLTNIALNDWECNPRQTALQALVKNFSDRPQTLDILNQVALNDADEQLREFAAKKLQELEDINL